MDGLSGSLIARARGGMFVESHPVEDYLPPVGFEPPDVRPWSRSAVCSCASMAAGYLLWSLPLFVNVQARTPIGGLWPFAVIGLFGTALVTGIFGMVATSTRERRGRGLAKAGLVLSICVIPVALIVVAFIAIAWSGVPSLG